MFNSVYHRVMAAASAVIATAGRHLVPMASGAPTKPYEPTLNNGRIEPRAERNRPRKRRHSSPSRKPNGIQECARRMRQIARGQLTVSNGLVAAGPGPQFCVNSHGKIVRNRYM
jgi:hypothetical protein